MPLKSLQKFLNSIVPHKELLVIYIALGLWWSYLCFVSQPSLVFDAVGYKDSARLIFERGFFAYLQSGPHREPLFPILTAAAMWIGNLLHVEYHYPLRFMGLASLLVTMIVTYRLMMVLNIHRALAALGLIFIGFSPSLLNSTLWFWSEFAAYPFVVLAVLQTIKSWAFLKSREAQRDWLPAARHGAVLALAFIGLMSVKAAAETVLVLYLIPFMIVFAVRLKKNDCKPWLVFILSVFLVFEGFVQGYKWMNQQANGHYQFTNRWDTALYGNTARRMEPLTRERLGAAVVMVWEPSMCGPLFGYSDCAFWTAIYSDVISVSKTEELGKQNLTDRQRSQALVDQSLRMVLANPLQAVVMAVIEAHKMFMWERPPAFVIYPEWIGKMVYHPLLSALLFKGMGVLCWAAWMAVIWMLLRRKPCSWLSTDERVGLWFVFSFVLWYAAVYSMFFILSRYALPVAPLFILLVAFVLNLVVQNIRTYFVNRFIVIARSPKVIEAISSAEACDCFALRARNDVKRPIYELISRWQNKCAHWLWWRRRLVWVSGICFIGLIVLIKPLTAHMVAEHRKVKESVKLSELAAYRPHFPYLASIVDGTAIPLPDYIEGYHDSRAYTFYTYFKMAVDVFPTDDAVHALFGFCNYYLKHPDEAKVSYEIALSLKPDFWWHYYNLAVIHFKNGEYERSAQLCQQILSLDHRASLAHLNQSKLYRIIWQSIDRPGAVLENNIRQSLEKIYLMLAVSYWQTGHPEKARQVAQKVLAGTQAQYISQWNALLKITPKGSPQGSDIELETNDVNKLLELKIF